MKRKMNLSILLAALIFIGFSCKKDEIAPQTERNVPKATIKGQVWADLDIGTDSPGLEAAPSGLKIIAQVWAPDLAGGINVDRVPETYINFEATTNATGEYTIQVDANTIGINVWLVPDDFAYNQKQGLDPVDSVQLPSIRHVYTSNLYQVAVVASGTVVQDIVYTESK